MPTIIPTKETGAKTLPTLMTITAPETQLEPETLSKLGAGAGFNGLFFANLMSCFLQQERDAVGLYRCVAERTRNDDWRSHYVLFGEQSLDHIRIYEELITRMGGDAQYVSPNARMREAVDTKLMEPLATFTGSVDEVTLELAGLEAVIAAEQQCQANWKLLVRLSEQIPDGAMKQEIQNAIRQVAPQEDEHVRWAKTTWEDTLIDLLTKR